VGETFTAAVLERDGARARIQITDPAITATCPVTDGVAAGQSISVVLRSADIPTGRIEFTEAPA
jgi:hypothetical protein